jgi:actin-related protein
MFPATEDLKRKMYGCILVVGGGMKFTGIGTWLQNRISLQIPYMYRAGECRTVSFFYILLTTGQNKKPVYTAFHPTNCMNKYCILTSFAQSVGNVTFSAPVTYLQIICTHFYIYHLALFL